MAKVFTITEGLENLGALKTGGQGSIYKGRRIGEIISAIKLLPTPIHSESAEDKNFIAFLNEVQKLKKVNEEPNPNVVKIQGYGITDSGNFPYIEMEFIEGPDLEELLKAPHDPVFTIKEVIRVADHLSCALAHCHKADVRHGDIKSNNVKYNVSNGNYVLLDFGLSVMSDEQRRTSLRHAGAIEFMAPEQNEGQMLFQTDIYSFGVILFELLAGRVPFPLNDKGETARNNVMLAHLETLPPDVLALRQESLPGNWSEQKKKEEMKVPEWLINMMYKCLEKRPKDRFENGIDLHNYIYEHTIQKASNTDTRPSSISDLQQENKRLRREKELLQQQLLQYQHLYKTNQDEREFVKKPIGHVQPERNTFFRKNGILFIIVFGVLSAAVYFFVKSSYRFPILASQKSSIIAYKLIASPAFLYNQASQNARKEALPISANENIKGLDEKNGFIYANIKDEKGQVLKGWLRKQDVITTDEWAKRNNIQRSLAPPNKEISGQLENAKLFFNSGKTVEALTIYASLAKQEDPEAMYQYGKLALQNKNLNITCAEAFQLIKKSSDKGYVPAERTLGFLYAFAEDKEVLQENNYYNRCVFTRDLLKGSKLLMEATLKGDTTASRLLDELNAKQVNEHM